MVYGYLSFHTERPCDILIVRRNSQLYVSPLESSYTPPPKEEQAFDINDDRGIKSILNIRRILKYHQGLRTNIPTIASSNEVWADFFREINSAMGEMYIEYVVHIPLTINRFRVEYFSNHAYRHAFKVLHGLFYRQLHTHH